LASSERAAAQRFGVKIVRMDSIRAVLLGLLVWCAAGAAAAQGITVAIGGALRDDNAEVWGRLVELAGGKGARFAVFATASADPDATAARIAANLQRHGAPDAAVRDAHWIARVRASRAVFFSGGEQERLMDTLRPAGRDTPLLDAIRALYAAGGVVAGTSSGAAVLSEVAVRDIRSPLAVLQGAPLRDGREVGIGFGFVPAGVVVDQHFIKRGRIGRLLPLLASRGQALGLGVEEDSAAIVRGDEVEVIGARGVLVADMSGATHERAPFAAQGVRLWWLQRGDRMTLATRGVTPAAHKRALDPAAPYYRGEVFVTDLLADGAIVGALQRVIDSDRRELRGLAFDALAAADDTAPGFEWRLHLGPRSRGWVGGTSDDVTVADVLLDIVPVRITRPLYTLWPSARVP
jgi:cyanophycinase